MKKIDTHVHLSYNKLPRTDKMFLSDYQSMLVHFEELGIEKAILMSGGEDDAPFGSNKENQKIVEADPLHYAWMCNLDYKDIDTIQQRLTTYKAQGAVGIGELMINRKIDDPFLQEIFRIAGLLDLPVTFHMSPKLDYSYGIVDDPGLPLLEQTLKNHPTTKIVGHSQTFWIEMSGDAPTDFEHRNQWGKGPIVPGGRVPELFEKYPNLYGDLSANSGGSAIMRDEEFGLNFLETYQDRLFFATDMVNTEMLFPLGAWLDAQVEAGRLSRQAYTKIVHDNAKRTYKI